MAHRGDPNQAPENTVEAMRGALEIGVDSLETDVRLTKDDHLVLFHDDDLKRTTGEEGKVRELTLDELRQIDLGRVFSPNGSDFPFRGRGLRVVTIREAFEVFPDARLNIDMKDDDKAAPAELAEAIREYEREDSVVVASFIPRTMERFREIMPSVPTSAHPSEVRRFLIGEKVRAVGLICRNITYRAFQVPVKYGSMKVLSRHFVEEAHKRNLAVHVWTINDRATMEWLIDLCVDGIFTDEAALMRQLLREKGLL
ncbi:MAG: glycerophosphodiester phosphodiesterase [Promethearchaeota archaeon]